MTTTQLDPTVERLAVAALLHDQEKQAHAAAWLRVDDFTDPAARVAWRTILTLRGRQRLADRDQVQAELRRDGTLDHPRRAADMAGVLDAKVPAPVAGARYALQVLEASLRREMDREGLVLRQLAVDDLPPGRLLDAARDRTARLGLAAARWHAATHEHPEQAPATAHEADLTQAQRLVDDITAAGEREERAYAEGMRAGYGHGYQVGYAHAENQEAAAWADLAAGVRRRANEPTHAELQQRRTYDQDPWAESGHRSGRDVPEPAHDH